MKRDKQKKATHVIAALIFILLAFYVFETPNIIVAFASVGLGIFFLIVAGVHDWLVKNYKDLSLLFIFLEAALMFVAAYIFFEKKHHTLDKIMGVLSVLFFIVAVYFMITKKRTKHKRRPRKNPSPSHGLLLLLFMFETDWQLIKIFEESFLVN